jgi:hypothetical protein
VTWSIETAFAIARRVARLRGIDPAGVYPIFRLRDHRLIAVYLRDVGRIPQ